MAGRVPPTRAPRIGGGLGPRGRAYWVLSLRIEGHLRAVGWPSLSSPFSYYSCSAICTAYMRCQTWMLRGNGNSHGRFLPDNARVSNSGMSSMTNTVFVLADRVCPELRANKSRDIVATSCPNLTMDDFGGVGSHCDSSRRGALAVDQARPSWPQGPNASGNLPASTSANKKTSC